VIDGSVHGPLVSYTATGGFSSTPFNVCVDSSVISRIGTRTSAREPVTWILRDAGKLSMATLCGNASERPWPFVVVDAPFVFSWLMVESLYELKSSR
jgi:hypothetical protein